MKHDFERATMLAPYARFPNPYGPVEIVSKYGNLCWGCEKGI